MKTIVMALAAGAFVAGIAGGCSSGEGGSLAVGLVAHYAFDGNALDTSPARNNGIIDGATFSQDRHGRANSAITFDGINDRVLVSQDRFAAGGSVSVSFWVKTEDFAGARIFMSCSDFALYSSVGGIGMWLALPKTNEVRGNIASGAWNHFVGTYDGATIRAYVNGQTIAALPQPGPFVGLGRPLTFGFYDKSYWTGSLDDVRIYDRALTQDEVRRLFEE